MTDVDDLRDKIIGAFDVGGKGFDPHELDIVVRSKHIRETGQIARVILPPNGTLVLNDENDETIDKALELHDWETGTIDWGDSGVVISVWKIGA